ncbi:MAG: hypothetical protein EXX96DRAFT_649226 [Benjaminiella poitrasii]|nr:MAG: hypothetical protein EXX96DRAFT_649226 [Benjaminiella poitrasii]
MFKCTIFLLTTLLAMVFADQIKIYGPPANALYFAKDIMDVRYKVRSIGMTKITKTTTYLTHIPTNNTIESFPALNWSISMDDAPYKSVHAHWEIPSNLTHGNYSMTVSAKASYLCSKNDDGKAPFEHCSSTLKKHRVFYISSGTQTDEH